ncbi:branched-chain amino acid ABC transporter permease [Halanaerobium kushneri]|uniref:Amino acid/amide ABC transporter membrane protein 2, HAAT family n=1 Tax=Halanaerobium kushneri TaxID=56779 RepID=A0A1N6S0U5_9FIRM|nr:branched-chain amino acid ABC transporter permease [Halanaerobium kushneri]SIQ34576.1 amino acid/amide ABC transporter membrane protein 2, HAAT family [Halanaerobium kushneri]
MAANIFEKIITNINKNKLKYIFLLIIVLLILPFVVENQYVLHIAVLTLMYVLLSSSLNVIVGYTGQYNIGHVAFYAIGAYTAAIISTRFNLNFIIVILISGFVASLFSLMLGIPTLRLRGIFFAFTTLGFAEITRLTILNWRSLTRGPFGIPGVPIPQIFGMRLSTNTHFYFMIFILLFLMLLMTYRIINSRVGRAWISIREDEQASASMGVDTFKYKIMNLMYGTFWAGVGGAFFAYFAGYVSADSFILDESFRFFAMVLVGGTGTLAGPILGGAVLTILPQVFRSFARYQMIIYGVAILLIIHYKPEGLLGGRTFKRDLSESEDN